MNEKMSIILFLLLLVGLSSCTITRTCTPTADPEYVKCRTVITEPAVWCVGSCAARPASR